MTFPITEEINKNIGGPFDLVAGLPIHPLVVHGVVVFTPLAAVFAIWLAIQPKRMKRWGRTSAVLAALSIIFGLVITQSGEALLARVVASDGMQATVITNSHTEYGDTAGNLAVLLGVGILVYLLATQSPAIASKVRLLVPVIRVLLIVGAIATVVMVILAGHTGAMAAWGDVVSGG